MKNRKRPSERDRETKRDRVGRKETDRGTNQEKKKEGGKEAIRDRDREQ